LQTVVVRYRRAFLKGEDATTNEEIARRQAMKRLLATTAVGLFIGMTPAFAEANPPADQSAGPPAVQQPAPATEELKAQEPNKSDPSASETPGQQSGMEPEANPAQPSAPASPPAPDDKSAAAPAAPDAEPAQPNADASPSAAPADKAAEAPESIIPDDADKSAEASDSASDSPQFLAKQESNDWLASDLIGRSVVNASNETIGEINDLITDEDGKIVAALIGAGGFLGIGEKDVAVRFEDLKLARDENGDISAMADLSNDTLASAPDYETLSEQQVTVGAAGEQSSPPASTP
jgi:PRC-barrel domain protein